MFLFFRAKFALLYIKKRRVSLFQSNLRKQIRKLPKILKSVKTIQYDSILFICVLMLDPGGRVELGVGRRAGRRGKQRRRREHTAHARAIGSGWGAKLRASSPCKICAAI